jgi:hypothetical protein
MKQNPVEGRLIYRKLYKGGFIMKRYWFVFAIAVVTLLFFSSCGPADNGNGVSFEATVLENNQSNLLVQPEEGSDELRSSDKIIVHINDDVKLLDSQDKEIKISDIKVGDKVRIFYNGEIAESYPAQINRCYKVKLLD